MATAMAMAIVLVAEPSLVGRQADTPSVDTDQTDTRGPVLNPHVTIRLGQRRPDTHGAVLDLHVTIGLGPDRPDRAPF